VSILVGGAVHVVCSLVRPEHYDWESSRQITRVDSVAGGDEDDEELREEKLVHAKRWIIKWGVGFTVVIVVLWPVLSVPAGKFNLGYFTLWAAIAIVWGAVGSAVIIVLPLVESWDTISMVCAGMLTNDIVYQRLDDVNLRLRAIMGAMPEAEKLYQQLQRKGEVEMHPAGTHPANDSDHLLEEN